MTYQLLLTTLGQQKLASAASAGGQPVRITEFAVGQGVNVDFSKRLDQHVLVSKRYQGNVESVASTAVAGQYEITCIVPQDQGGWAIREIGLIDSAGDLIWVGQVPEVQKPVASSTAAVDYRIKAVISIDNPDVNLVIDANVVTATQSWVTKNFVSNPRFAQFLNLAFPFGYPYWSHSKSNPKPLFDAMFGFETYWRRLEGVGLVAVKDGDSYIGQPMLTLGQVGNTELATTGRPHTYPIHTSYLYERYDPSTVVETVWKVVANKTSINEGDAVRFTVTANNLPDGQILNWSVKEGKLNSASNDITSPDKTDSGTVILNNGQAIINFTTTSDDNEAEPQKHVRLTVGAPANLSIKVPVNDAGHNETIVHISQSTTDGINLAEYYKAQYGAYPSADDTVRFIVDAGVDIIAPNTTTPALIEGVNWPTGTTPIVENRGRILGRGGNGGTSACFYIVNGISTGGILSAEKGGNGGTAIKGNITVENYSLIAGGGGGGGGMGAGYGGDAGFIGGGGSGGGAPFGKADLNANTYPKYLEDDTMPTAKVAIPNDGRTYFELTVYKDKVNLTATDSHDTFFDGGDAGNPATFATYNRQVMYVSIIRWLDEIAGTYGVGDPTRNSYPVMQMSQDATLENGGLAGYGGGYGGSYLLPYRTQYGRDPSLNHGGKGGSIGENGDSGVITQWLNNTGGIISESVVENKVPSQSGGLAGYIKEGNVTINNLTNGVTKGR